MKNDLIWIAIFIMLTLSFVALISVLLSIDKIKSKQKEKSDVIDFSKYLEKKESERQNKILEDYQYERLLANMKTDLEIFIFYLKKNNRDIPIDLLYAWKWADTEVMERNKKQ